MADEYYSMNNIHERRIVQVEQFRWVRMIAFTPRWLICFERLLDAEQSLRKWLENEPPNLHVNGSCDVYLVEGFYSNPRVDSSPKSWLLSLFPMFI